MEGAPIGCTPQVVHLGIEKVFVREAEVEAVTDSPTQFGDAWAAARNDDLDIGSGLCHTRTSQRECRTFHGYLLSREQRPTCSHRVGHRGQWAHPVESERSQCQPASWPDTEEGAPAAHFVE